jgi:hypothetical protein
MRSMIAKMAVMAPVCTVTDTTLSAAEVGRRQRVLTARDTVDQVVCEGESSLLLALQEIASKRQRYFSENEHLPDAR